MSIRRVLHIQLKPRITLSCHLSTQVCVFNSRKCGLLVILRYHAISKSFSANKSNLLKGLPPKFRKSDMERLYTASVGNRMISDLGFP